jgi:hypothetical protein
MEFTAERRILAEEDENFTCRQRSTAEAAKISPNNESHAGKSDNHGVLNAVGLDHSGG